MTETKNLQAQFEDWKSGLKKDERIAVKAFVEDRLCGEVESDEDLENAKEMIKFGDYRVYNCSTLDEVVHEDVEEFLAPFEKVCPGISQFIDFEGYARFYGFDDRFVEVEDEGKTAFVYLY